jgi:hypothetical protein
MRKLAAAVIALGGVWLAPAAQAQSADSETAPDLDFLEYLGSWLADDDEWWELAEWDKSQKERPKGEDRDKDDAQDDEDGDEHEDSEGEKPEQAEE